jgi:predicted PurR-regulated permease PerM
MAPLARRPRFALLTDEILARTGGYILGNLLTSLIAIICHYIIVRALGVPYALALSVFVGILDLVPLIGSTIAGALVTLVALATVSPAAAISNIVARLQSVDASLLQIERSTGFAPMDRRRLGLSETKQPSLVELMMGDVKARREADL